MKLQNIIVWICKKFNREQIQEIIDKLLDVLNDKYSAVKPRDDFREKHPHYRDFKVDPLAPLESVEFIKPQKQLDYKILMTDYLKKHGKSLEPVKRRQNSPPVPSQIECPHCGAPQDFNQST